MADIEENSKYSISENEESSSFCSSFRLLGRFIVFIIKVNFKLFVNFLHGIWRFVVPKTKKKIEGQVVLVTGGANGIGKEIVLEFARKKCKIAIVDIDCEAACKLAEELRNEFKIEAKAFRVDVSNYEEVYELRGLVQDALGTVDILVNNAAIVTTNISLLEGSYEEIQKIVDVNLTSNLWVSCFLR
jgi:all-trans-retinol dehydrogenase (NAD+)